MICLKLEVQVGIKNVFNSFNLKAVLTHVSPNNNFVHISLALFLNVELAKIVYQVYTGSLCTYMADYDIRTEGLKTRQFCCHYCIKAAFEKSRLRNVISIIGNNNSSKMSMHPEFFYYVKCNLTKELF